MIDPKQKPGRYTHLLASLAFVPMIGLFLAPFVIVWGLWVWRKGSATILNIGLGGVAFNYIFATGFNIYVAGRQDTLHLDKHVKHILPEIVETIEAFKSYEGAYPKSLDSFKPDDVQGREMRLEQEIIDRLYYEVDEGGDKYILLGVGTDNEPFTDDDIVSTVAASDIDQPGLNVKK